LKAHMRVEGELGRTVHVYADVDLYPENGDYYLSELRTISISTRDEIAAVFLRNTKVEIEMVLRSPFAARFSPRLPIISHTCVK
jgi:hypothetical protein